MFNERFILDNPNFANTDISSTRESELMSMSGELQRMVDSIRRVDATLSRASVKDIYFVITEYSDPKIGGILASAKDANTNKRIFDNLDQVRQIMFSEFENMELNIFNDTVRQAAVTLAASRLVGNLSPAGQNFQGHAQFLYNSAVKDIERIVETIDIRQLQSTLAQEEDQTETGSAFIFESFSFTETNLKVEVFLSGGASNWETVATYNEDLTTARLVTDISDFINSQTLTTLNSNLIAAPVLNYQNNRHAIFLQSRNLSTSVSTEVVSIRITIGDNISTTLPFQWGIDADNLHDHTVNSLLLATGFAGASGTDSTKPLLEDNEGIPSVLYFRRKIDLEETLDLSKQELRYRISPLQEEPTRITFPYNSFNSSQRASLLALELLNSLHSKKSRVKCVGAIIKSDPDSLSQPITALELIGYTLSSKYTTLVLDLLDIPDDIEVAVGDLRAPITTFSNKPRSIRVSTIIDLSNMTPEEYREESGKENKPRIIGRPPSPFLHQVQQKLEEHKKERRWR